MSIWGVVCSILLILESPTTSKDAEIVGSVHGWPLTFLK